VPSHCNLPRHSQATNRGCWRPCGPRAKRGVAWQKPSPDLGLLPTDQLPHKRDPQPSPTASRTGERTIHATPFLGGVSAAARRNGPAHLRFSTSRRRSSQRSNGPGSPSRFAHRWQPSLVRPPALRQPEPLKNARLRARSRLSPASTGQGQATAAAGPDQRLRASRIRAQPGRHSGPPAARLIRATGELGAKADHLPRPRP